ncbi:DUF302 domain-containing protein [Priestia megaterium]|jgi:uncharacterized protein (DUF302 family)|uniref:DUF302 domain-containing protein n=1 Tax=Priestia TaxID=2800373 RepID=UPI0005C73B55|nr:DUF302 domain-containing protein [Priestia megaterium]MEB2264583.1 DUF302 domain-containing protein [Priestia megaterium]PFK03196.1 DUF302 domain-containing protein [Priestia megaterium]PMD10544.1 DUF302 domain-containing protein [Priestia megaterium]WJD79320.1 DUF302 domain-containing protein [Priestia megaterium]
MFDYTVKTPKSLEEAISSLEENLKSEGFGVLWNFDLTAKLQEKGQDFHTPFTVLEVCNPKEAQRVLSQNLLVGYFLPCKMVVYQDGSETKIGMPRPTAMINMLHNEELQRLAEDIEARLIRCIDQSV